MLMHHSRDTAEKQWNESRVHVLQGLSRIFRQFFDVMESLPNFPSHWSEYLSILEFSIINPWHEVSICAIQCLKESLQAVPVVKALAKKRDLVYVALQVYKNVVEAALSKQSNVDFTAYPILIESVSELLQGNQDVENSPLFTTEDMQMFLTLADTLSSVDPESLSIKSNMARETSLQRATLQLIDRLSFLSGPSHIWATILLQVIKYVRQALPESAHYWEDLIKNRKSQEMNAKVQTHSERTRAVSISSNSASFAFAQKAIPTLTILFCERLSLELRGTLSLFSSVLSSLLDVCTCSSISKVSPLSKVAFSAAIQVLEAGLDALNESSSMVDSANIDEFWFALRESFSMYLSTSNSVHVFDEVDDNSRVASAEIEELDCRLVNTVCHIVLPKSNTMSSSVRSEWIEMLSKYWRLALLDSGRFANMSTIQCSISGLFFLCSQTQGLTGAHVDTLKMTIGTQVAPVIIDLSTKIFRKYLEDERRSGQRPVALDHRSHVVHILKNILELRCSPVLQFGANPNSHATRTGECNLQLALFPLFSGLIVAREEIIKDYLRQIFLLIAEELGF